MKPWMHNKEIKMIESYLHMTDTMLEWGSGGSTLHFPKFVKKYFSIEHNKEWYDKIKNEIPDNVAYTYVKQNLPRTRPTKFREFKDYIEKAGSFNKKFDKVLVDGRARPECAIWVLPYLNQNAVVFIHDYFMAGRDHYKKVEQYYNVIDKVTNTEQTLAVFKRKNNGV